MTLFGFVGSGSIGSEVAHRVLELGHEVVMSNSRGPGSLRDLVGELGPGARAATVLEAATEADVVVVGVPLRALQAIPAAPLAGKVVVDSINWYPPRDGDVPELRWGETTTSTLVQQHLAGAAVVKGFNHIAAGEVRPHGRPPGTPGRRALALASDHADAATFLAELYDAVGYDCVDLGPLSESWRVEYGRPAFLTPLDARSLRVEAARAPRVVALDD